MYRVNTLNGQVDFIVTTDYLTGDIAFAPNGKLYGTFTNLLYEIDTITGHMIVIHNFISSNTIICGLTIDYNNIVYTYGYQPNIGPLGEIIKYDLNNNNETYLGYTGYEGWDLDFYKGKLVASCGEFLNNDYYLLEINNSDVSINSIVVHYPYISPFGITSVCNSCDSFDLFSVTHNYLIKYDVNNQAATGTFNPNIIRPQGATSLTSWIGSLPPLAIDSVTNSTDNSGCASLSSITIHAKDRGIPIQYSIDGITYQNDSLFLNKTPGKYHVFIRDTLGCTREDSITLDGVPVGYVEKIEVTDITCASGNGQLNILAGYKDDMLSYSLDGVNYITDTLFKNLSAGPGLLYVSSTSGCNDTINYNINTIPLSPFTLQSSEINCHNLAGTIVITTGDASLTFSVDNGTAQSSNSPWIGLDDGIHQVEIIDSNGCISQEVISINTVPLPALNYSFEPPHCHLSDGSINVTSDQPKVQFDINNAGFQLLNNFSSLDAGDYVLSVMDSIGCVNTAIIKLTDLPGTQIISLDAEVLSCDSIGTITFINDNANPVSFILDGGTPQSSNIFKDIKVGIHEGVIIDNSGCTDTLSVQLLPYMFPLINIDVQNEVCGQTNGLITLLPQGLTPFTYSISQNNYQSGNVFQQLSAGNYTVIAKDKNGCEVKIEAQMINEGSLQIDKILKENDICESGKGIIKVQMPGSGPFQYKIDGSSYKNEPLFEGLKKGTYQILVKDNTGCVANAEVVITNINTLELTSAGPTDATCGMSNGSLHIGASSDSPVLYNINNGAFQAGSVFNNLPKGSYYMIGKNESGCTVDTTLYIDNIGNILVEDIALKSADCGENNGFVIVSASDNADNNLTYQLNDFENTTGTFNDIKAGAYQLTIRNANTCNYETSLQIEQGPCDIFVPNVFSPNFDGINDNWEPNYDPTKIIILSTNIFDRWGASIFSGDGVQKKSWDGSFRSKTCSAGVYVYWIEYKDVISDKVFRIKGDVTLVR